MHVHGSALAEACSLRRLALLYQVRQHFVGHEVGESTRCKAGFIVLRPADQTHRYSCVSLDCRLAGNEIEGALDRQWRCVGRHTYVRAP